MPEPNIEKFMAGQFSLTPEEAEKAKKEGKLKEEQEKMKKATGRLRAKQSEEAVKQLEKSFEEENWATDNLELI